MTDTEDLVNGTSQRMRRVTDTEAQEEHTIEIPVEVAAEISMELKDYAARRRADGETTVTEQLMKHAATLRHRYDSNVKDCLMCGFCGTIITGEGDVRCLDCGYVEVFE
jgi:hypothetical protein